MEDIVRRAVEELKASKEWKGYEERISCEFKHPPKTASSGTTVRVIALIILRGESPETIQVCFEMNTAIRKSAVRAHVDEIKRQIKAYFESEAHQKSEWPKAFTIRELLEKDPKVSHWFYQKALP